MERKTKEESDDFKSMLELPVKYTVFQILEAVNIEYVVEYLAQNGYQVTKADEASAAPGTSLPPVT